MLETNKDAIMNGQSRNTGNIRYIIHRTKTNKTQEHNTTLQTKMINNRDTTNNRRWINLTNAVIDIINKNIKSEFMVKIDLAIWL